MWLRQKKVRKKFCRRSLRVEASIFLLQCNFVSLWGNLTVKKNGDIFFPLSTNYLLATIFDVGYFPDSKLLSTFN